MFFLIEVGKVFLDRVQTEKSPEKQSIHCTSLKLKKKKKVLKMIHCKVNASHKYALYLLNIYLAKECFQNIF